MAEKLNAHINNLTSKDATIDNLTSEFLKLKQQIELLYSELKIVKNNTEIAKFSESRVDIKPTLNTNTINNSSTIDTSSLKSSNIENSSTIKTQTLESTTIKGHTIYSNNVLVSVPIGIIVAFYGTSIPDGWALCDGSYNNNLGANVPDLREKFIRGAYHLAKNTTIYGADSVTLNNNNLPSHNHSYQQTRISLKYGSEVEDNPSGYLYIEGDHFNNSQSLSFDRLGYRKTDEYTSSVGNATPINIVPKHIQLAYIIKVK